jgi:hypothetical protein
MTQKEQEVLLENFTSKMKKLILSKRQDYSEDTDVMSNFKVAGDLSGLGSAMECLALISMKVARLSALLSEGKSPNHESMQDSLVDLANYAFLLSAIISEE